MIIAKVITAIAMIHIVYSVIALFPISVGAMQNSQYRSWWIIDFILTVTTIIAAGGLVKLKKWARYLYLCVCAAWLFSYILRNIIYLGVVSWSNLSLGYILLIIFFLMPQVKQEFK